MKILDVLAQPLYWIAVAYNLSYKWAKGTGRSAWCNSASAATTFMNFHSACLDTKCTCICHAKKKK